MSRYRWNDEKCPGCGIKYRDFRCSTIGSFQEAKDALWSSSGNPKDWRYRRKHTVLGFWHMTKKSEWFAHIQVCEAKNDYDVDEGDVVNY